MSPRGGQGPRWPQEPKPWRYLPRTSRLRSNCHDAGRGSNQTPANAELFAVRSAEAFSETIGLQIHATAQGSRGRTAPSFGACAAHGAASELNEAPRSSCESYPIKYQATCGHRHGKASSCPNPDPGCETDPTNKVSSTPASPWRCLCQLGNFSGRERTCAAARSATSSNALSDAARSASISCKAALGPEGG